MQTEKMQKGQVAEELVCRYLAALGYEIIARNFRKPFGEIDIVAVETATRTLCFVETRSSSRASAPLLHYSVSPRKQQRLRRAMQSFLLERRAYRSYACRMDMAWVSADRVEYWKNVELGVH